MRHLTPTGFGKAGRQLFCAVAASAVFVMPSFVSAQDSEQGQDLSNVPIRSASRLCFGMTDITEPQALAVCDALALDQNVRARELAQQWVAEAPDSPGAQYALAEVLFRVEGNLPRALYHLNIAESLTNYTSLGRALESGNLVWHYLTLSQLSYAHQLIGNQEESLVYLDKISQIYGQDTESFRGWPLIKMKRYDEARESAEKVLSTSNSPGERSRAWNTLCAVELADLRPNESLAACQNAMNEDTGIAAAQGFEDLDTVHLLNSAEVSLNLLQFAEAEDFLDRASRRMDPDSVGNPWVYKLYLYMNQSRFDEARQALDRMLVWRENQTPLVGVMNRADHFMVSAAFLLLSGYADDAARLTQAALNQPDRTGSYTADEAQKDSYSALVNSMAHQMRYQQIRERMATRPWFSNGRLWIEAQAARFQAWRTGRLAASLFADEQTLVSRLRPYAPLDVHIPEWMEHELIDLIGAGVMAELLDAAAAEGAFTLNEGYYFAYQSEIHARQGRRQSLLTSAEQALRLLPGQEVMLRARVSARLANALWRDDRHEEAIGHFTYALRHDPSLFRRLDIALPVTLTTGNTLFSSDLSDYLQRSPRFMLHNQGLAVSIQQDGDAEPTLCLRDRQGDSLSCVQAGDWPEDRPALQEDDEELDEIAVLMRQFQHQTFALGYNISRSQRLALLGTSVIISSRDNSNLQQQREAVLGP